MIDLDAFLPSIFPFAPGVAEPTAFAYIIRAAQTFSERGRLWRADASVAVTPVSVNIIPVPAGAELFEIESARMAERDLKPISISDLDYKHPGWRTQTNDSPRWYTQTTPGSLLLVPACTGQLDVSMFLRPSDSATQLPDLFSQYTEVIADGALAKILLLPDQPFSNPQLAQFYGERFDNRIDSLFNRTVQGQQRAPIRSRARFF